MKKWFITFCALGLISTQVPTADAASNGEEAPNKSERYVVKVTNMDQYEDLLAGFKNELSFADINSLVEFSNNKLSISKTNLEKLIAEQLKEYNKQYSSENSTSKTPVNNENTTEKVNQENNKVETPKTTAPSTPAESGKSQGEVTKPQTPVTKPETAPSTPTAPTEKVETTKPATSEVKDNSVSAFEAKVVELTNAERAKNGLSPLSIDNQLMKVAHAKSQDMATNKYFSHTSPTYGSPFDQIKAAGITYRAAGENIAQGQRTPEEVVQAWMNSSGHRANILNANFTHIGVGYVENGNYWTQQFIQK